MYIHDVYTIYNPTCTCSMRVHHRIQEINLPALLDLLNNVKNQETDRPLRYFDRGSGGRGDRGCFGA